MDEVKRGPSSLGGDNGIVAIPTRDYIIMRADLHSVVYNFTASVFPPAAIHPNKAQQPLTPLLPSIESRGVEDGRF